MTGCERNTRLPALAVSPEIVVAARVGPMTFNPDSDDRLIPFEHALLTQLADSLKKPLRIVPLRSTAEVVELVAKGQAHLGAGWLLGVTDARVVATRGFHIDRLTLVQSENSVEVDHVEALAGRSLHVAAGAQLGAVLEGLAAQGATGLTVVERPDGSGLGLIRSVADGEIELTVAPGELAGVAQNYHPEILPTLALDKPRQVVWITADTPANDVLSAANAFLDQFASSGALVRLKDTHLAYRRRLTPQDTARFIERVNGVLPRYHALFKQAQIRTGIDWRLLAALAYQESQWEADAVSPTGVRGIMMLTEDTADRLNVNNRLDPKESILAGADYFASLRDELPAGIEEPDRTWLALAAFNLGMGHLRGARSLAPKHKLNPDLWFDMKKMLPLLARPEVYERLKSGRARGGEAVILVENVRAYYDILSRHSPAYSAMADGSDLAASGPGLKPPRPRPQAAGMSSAPAM